MKPFGLRKCCTAHVLQTHEQRVQWQLPKKDGLVLMLCGRDDAGKTATAAHTHPSASSSQLERFLLYSPLRGKVSEGILKQSCHSAVTKHTLARKSFHGNHLSMIIPRALLSQVFLFLVNYT